MSKIKMVNARVFSGGTRDFPVSKIAYFRPSAYGIIINVGKIALLHNRNSPKLSFPGGGIELGETNQEAVKREVMEEIGLRVRVDQLLAHDQDFFYYNPKDILVHTFLFFYRCTPLTLDLHPDDQVNDDESMNPRWFPIENLAPDQLVSHGRQVLNYAVTGLWE